MLSFNFDPDLRAKMQAELDPLGSVFTSLPVCVQIERVLPYVELQKQRDRTRLAEYMEAA